MISTPTWFPNTGVNQHVMPDLTTLTNYAPYLGNDHLYVGDDKGLSISHIWYNMLPSPKVPLHYLMFLILLNHYYLFRNFIMIIIFILNFIHLYFM